MPIGVTYGLVTGISDAITPAGLAYLTMPFSGISSMMPMLFWRSASRRMPSTLARRVGSRLPMPLSSTLMFASRVAVALVAAGPGDGAAQPIDRRLVVALDRPHRGARAADQRLDHVGFFRGDRSCSHATAMLLRLTAARRRR